MTDVIRLLRDVHVKRVSTLAYARMFDRHAELEQLYVGLGRLDMADEARMNAAIAFRAWQAEDKNPEPSA